MSSQPDIFAGAGPVPCADHPDVETRLRCSRCGKPICPRCAVRTPVGMRCPDCAGTRSSSKADPAGTLVAAGAGLVVATLVGVVWGFLPEWQFYLALALGFGVVETMAKLLRSRTGVDLQIIAIAIVLYGLVLSRVVMAQRLGVPLDAIADLGQFTDRLYLRPVPDLVFAVLPILIAWIRFR